MEIPFVCLAMNHQGSVKRWPRKVKKEAEKTRGQIKKMAKKMRKQDERKEH